MSPSTFRETVALVAARAKEKLPVQVNGRIESAVKLVLAHDVLFLDNGTVEVGSASDPLKVHVLSGSTCDCADFPRLPCVRTPPWRPAAMPLSLPLPASSTRPGALYVP